MTLIDKAEALLPCPFCGGESDIMTPEDDQMRKAVPLPPPQPIVPIPGPSLP